MSGRLTAHLAAPILVALVLAGCGEPDGPSRSGRLVVEKSLAAGPIFSEGSVTHLRVAGRDGDEVVDALRPVATLDVPLLDRAVPAGTYEVTAVERPCQGNCSQLDPPPEGARCVIEADVRAGQVTRVSIVLRDDGRGPRSDCSTARDREGGEVAPDGPGG